MSITASDRLSPLRTVAHTLGFTEGPVWTASERLFVTSVNRGVVYEIFLDGRAPRVVAESGGGPNGMTLGADGALWVTQNGGNAMPSRSLIPTSPGLQRIRVDARTISSVPISIPLTSPSDCVADDRGRVWFTDPNGHEFGQKARPGRVLRHDIATGVTESVLDEVYFPNGIALDAAGQFLYVAETARDRVSRYELTEDGIRASRSAQLRVDTPDGIAVDIDGGLWVAGSRSGKVSYFDPQGNLMRSIDIGSGTMPTSVCFAGPGMTTLIITVAKGGRVLAVEIDVPGLTVPTTLPPFST